LISLILCLILFDSWFTVEEIDDLQSKIPAEF